MKINFQGLKENFDSEQISIIQKFIKFLKSQFTFDKNVKIIFLEKRDRKMTTGLNNDNHEIVVLAGNRLLIDVLRTLSHEWVHEFQRPIPKNKKVKKIGGTEENMANIFSGILVKKFAMKHPELKDALYGEEE